MNQMEFTAVPTPDEDYAQEVLRLIGEPDLAINILDATPEHVDMARRLAQTLYESNRVHLLYEDGRLWWGPTNGLALQQIATLIAFRKPLVALLEEGFEPVDPPDLNALEAMLGNSPGGFPEQMLQDLGMRQGQEWGYTMDGGRMEAGINLDGLLLMVDKCAAEQGWPDDQRDELKAEFRLNWFREHGGGAHG